MSKLGILRKAWGYEADTPTCRTCVNYEPQKILLRNSLPVAKSPAVCKPAGFTVKPNGCCNRWTDKSGATLVAA